MIRILLVEGRNMEAGGVEAYLLNVLSNLKRDNFKISILVPGKIVSHVIAERFQSFDCDIYELHIRPNKSIDFLLKLNRHLTTNKYDIIHVNTANLRVEALCLSMAKRKGIVTRIAHSHGTLFSDSIIKEAARNILRRIIVRSATNTLACSLAAAEALVGKKCSHEVLIAKNGIKAKEYKYDPQKRIKIREQNGWNDRFVIGFIARISPEKNHFFMLQVVKNLVLKNKQVLLAIVGVGDESYEKQVRDQAKRMKLIDNVQFMGERNDVNELVQGMDVHVLPSTREALGIVNIEAQASGLHCVCSDRVPKEADVTGLVDFIPLEKGPDFWAKSIEKYYNGYNRKDTTGMIIAKGYDITYSAKIIAEIYNRQLEVIGGGYYKVASSVTYLDEMRCVA